MANQPALIFILVTRDDAAFPRTGRRGRKIGSKVVRRSIGHASKSGKRKVRKETTAEKKFKREGEEEEEEEGEREGGKEEGAEEGEEEEKEIRGELVIPFRLELRGSAIRHSIAYTHSRVRQGDNNQLFWSI